jgi:hypothetical protein
MRKSAFEPCIPTKAAQVPDRPDWIHEIKHDGYRLIVQREDKRVRLFTRNGHDWSDRFPLIPVGTSDQRRSRTLHSTKARSGLGPLTPLVRSSKPEDGVIWASRHLTRRRLHAMHLRLSRMAEFWRAPARTSPDQGAIRAIISGPLRWAGITYPCYGNSQPIARRFPRRSGLLRRSTKR